MLVIEAKLSPISDNCRQHTLRYLSLTFMKLYQNDLCILQSLDKFEFSKINAIKKRIDDIEAAAAIHSDSDLNLSDLSD